MVTYRKKERKTMVKLCANYRFVLPRMLECFKWRSVERHNIRDLYNNTIYTIGLNTDSTEVSCFKKD